MALVTCPECGKENVSSSASACPCCGFDLKGYQQKLEEERIAEEKELKAQVNLEMQKMKDEEEHQKELDAVPDPKAYGQIAVYVGIGILGIVLGVSASFLWVVLAAIGCGAYWFYSNREYKRFLDDPTAYKEEKLNKMKSKTSKEVDIEEPKTKDSSGKAFCPKCGSEDITRQVFQENKGSKTITLTKSKYKEKGHGCLWWLFIGWWWWAVDLCFWIFAFLPRLILRLFAAPFKKKKYVGKSTSVAETVNKISYRTICTCQKCGHTWG